MQETQVRFLGWEDPLEKGMATHSSILFFFFHSSILAWRIPWTEEPGGLQSMGSQSLTLLKQLTYVLGPIVDTRPSAVKKQSPCPHGVHPPVV